MKNLLDKPSRSRQMLLRIYFVLQIIILIVLLTILYVESRPSKIAETTEQMVDVEDTLECRPTKNIRTKDLTVKDDNTDSYLVANAKPETIIIESKKKIEVQVSRGSDVPQKTTSQRDIINKYVTEISAKYNMSPELIKSVIVSESNYNPRCLTGQCRGLMQVNPRWHSDRAQRLGVTDFYDPYGNILLGVDYLSELTKQYKDIRLALMLYNMDHDTAIKMYKNGQISDYAKTIITRAEQFKKGE